MRRKTQRRSQADRRESTRRKLLEAALHCLAEYGYAGTRVSQVVAHAGVSRGAWGHYFSSMNAMYLEAAQYLMTKVYERINDLLTELQDSQDLLRGTVYEFWQEFFASDVHKIYLELLIASRRDPKLAEKLLSLSETIEHNLTTVSEQFFEARPGAVDDVGHIMFLSRWVMRGIALDAHALPEGTVETALDTWHKLLATQIQPRQQN